MADFQSQQNIRSMSMDDLDNNELFINLPNFSICAIDDQYICGVKKVCAVIGNSLKNYEDNYCLQLICSNDVYLLDDNGNTVERL